jgi:hypothetical protein
VGTVFLTAVNVEAGLTGFVRMERTAGESLGWTCFDATPAIVALGGEERACFQRDVGQDSDPAHARPHLRGDQQTARADPTQTRQPRRQLVGEEALKILPVHSV